MIDASRRPDDQAVVELEAVDVAREVIDQEAAH